VEAAANLSSIGTASQARRGRGASVRPREESWGPGLTPKSAEDPSPAFAPGTVARASLTPYLILYQKLLYQIPPQKQKTAQPLTTCNLHKELGVNPKGPKGPKGQRGHRGQRGQRANGPKGSRGPKAKGAKGAKGPHRVNPTYILVCLTPPYFLKFASAETPRHTALTPPRVNPRRAKI